MIRALLGGLIFASAAAVLGTRRLGICNWQTWAIMALLFSAEFLGVNL